MSKPNTNTEQLARSLCEKMSKLAQGRRFEEFAAEFHPLDLAKFKNVVLAILDAAHNCREAEQFCSRFDRHIQRQELVSLPPDQLFATYCQAVLYSQQADQDGQDACGESWQYCGVVEEDEETLHVLYRVMLWPTVATFRRFDGRWVLTARGELAKLSAFMREVELSDSPDFQLKKIQDLIDRQFEEVRVIGRVDEERWSHLVCFLSTSGGGLVSESYEVWTITESDPSYALLDEPAALEQTLRERHHEQRARLVDTMRAMSDVFSQADEDPT